MKNRNLLQQNPLHKISAWMPIFALAFFSGLGAITANAQNGTWTGAAGDGLWSDSGNWLNGQVATGSAYTAYFNAVDITTDPTVVHLNSSETIGTLVFGDLNTSTAAGWLLDNNGNAANTLTLAGPSNIVVNALGAGKQVTIGAILAGSGGLKKTGVGTLDLTNVNTLTGNVSVNQGTLSLDYSGGASTVLGSQVLSLGGGSLTVLGLANNAVTQTFASTTLNAGQNIITAVNGAGTGSTTVALGSFGNPPVGGIVEFIGPATATGATTVAGQVGAGTGTATGTITTSSGAVGATNSVPFNDGGTGLTENETAYATVGLYDFASVTGSSPYTVIGVSQGSVGSTGDGGYIIANGTLPTSSSLTTCFDMIGSFTLPANAYQYGGWRFNANAYSSVTINQVTGASLLVTPNVGANNIEIIDGSGVSGALEPGARNSSNPGSLILWQNNTQGFLQLDNKTLWNGKSLGSAFVQAGPGTIFYIGTNGYTGPTYVNNGVAVITSGYSFGTNNGTAANAAFLNGGTIVAATNSVTFDNAGANPHAVTLGNNGGGLGAGSNFTLTVDGVVSGSGPLFIGIPPSSANSFSTIGRVPGTGAGTANLTEWDATGTVLLKGANTYSGGVVLYSGVLTYVTGSLGTGGFTFSGGAFQWPANTPYDLSSQTVTLNSAGGTLDLNGNTITLNNSIGNGGPGGFATISTNGNSVLNLNSTTGSSYSGNTTIGTNTTLNVNNTSGSATGSGSVTVNGMLAGSGIIAGNVTVGATGQTFPSGGSVASTSTLTLGGNLTYTSGAVHPTNANFVLSASGTGQTGAANDEIILSGAGSVLTPNGVSVGISCGANLDTVNAYVLFNLTGGGSISGNFNPVPVWLGTPPAEAGNYVVGVIGNQVVLVYSLDPTITAAAATPGTAAAYQSFTINATAIQGTNTVPVASVTANLSAINLGSSVALTYDGLGTSNYTVTEQVPYNVSPSNYTIAVTARDTRLGFATSNITLTVTVPSATSGSSSQTWDGKGADALWSDALNWTNGVAAGFGDSIYFDGLTDLAPVMNNSYSMSGVTFNSTAGGFNITASGGSALTLTGGVTNLSSHPQTLNVPISVNATTVPVSDAGSGVVFSGVVSGPVSNTLATAGNVTLGSANPFSGTNLMTGGTLLLGNSLALQNSTLNYAAGNVSFGSLTAASIGALTGSQSLTLKNATPAAVNLTLGNNSTNAYTGNLSDSGLGASVVMNGTGTQTLSGNNAYTGTTTINSGTLAIGGSGQLSGGIYGSAIANAGTFNYNSSLPQTLSGLISGSGVLSQTGAGALTLSDANTYTGRTIIGPNSTLIISGAGQLGAGTYAANIADNGALTYASSQPQTLSGIISGTGGLNQNGAGLLTLTSANTFTGTTTIAAGSTLQLNVAGGLSGSTLNYSSGLVTFNGISSAVLGGLSGSQGLYMTNLAGTVVNLTVGGNGTSTTYSGALNDNGLGATLTKGSGGTLTLSGNNIYGGTTYITGGTLRIGDPGQLNSGSYAGPVSCNGVAFEYASSLPQTFTGQMSGNGAIINVTGTGTLTLAYAGSETITGSSGGSIGIMNPLGGLIVSGSAALGGGNYTYVITNNGTFTYSSSSAQTLSGVIYGTGSFVENGTGNLTVSGNNLYTGNWTVNGAVLSVGADTNLGAPPALATTNMIILNGGDLLNTGAAVTWNTNRGIGIGPTTGATGATGLIDTTGANLIVGGAIASAGNTGVNSLSINTLTGTGTVALAGTNSFNGPITDNAGALIITNAGNLGLGSYAGDISDNVAFTYASSAPQTLSGVVSGSCTLNVTGAGPLTLTGANSYSGNTTVNSGSILTLSGVGQLGNGSYSANIINNGTLNFNSPGGQSVSGEISGTGSTSINAGTLSLSGAAPAITSTNIAVAKGATLDVSGVSSFALTSQTLQSSGTINGSFTASSGSKIYAGLNGSYGTCTFNNNLTLSGSAAAYFVLSTSSTANDSQIVVGGSLTLNGNPIHIQAPSTTSRLYSGNYVLFTATGGVTGNAATQPVWDVQPANAYNYSIATVGNQVLLQYSAVTVTPPTAVGSITPTNLYIDQSGLVTVTVTPGSSSTISSVVLDESPLYSGTPTPLTLVRVNSSYVYTNTLVIPNNELPQGPYTLTATVTDGYNSTAAASISFFVTAGVLWDGLGSDSNWGTTANWVGNAAPQSGDSVVFDGTRRPTPNMDSSYSLLGLTFDSTAGIFTLGSTGGYTLSVNGGVTNDSPNVETLNLQISAPGAAMTINSASNSLVFEQSIDTGSGIVTVTDGGYNTTVVGAITDSGGWTMAGIGTNTLLGTNTYSGGTTISKGGTLVIGTTGELGGGDYTGAITNNGTFDYYGTNVQTLGGVISGIGPLNVIGLLPYTGTNGTLILTAANTFTNNIIISNAWVSDDAGEQNSTGPTAGGLGNPQIVGRTVTINSNGVLSLDSGGNLFGSGSSAPAFTFVINQGGMMQITAGNTTIGPLILNGGTLITGNYASGAAQYQPFELGGSVTVGGSSASLITNSLDMSGGLNLTVNTGGGAQTLFTVASTGAAGPDLTVWVPLVDSGSSLASAGLIKAGPGTMALAGSNIYSGVTTISNGILNLGVAESAGTNGPLGLSAAYNPGSIVFAGGTLQYSAVNNNDYSGRFSAAAGQPVIIDTAGQSVTFAEPLTSPGGSLTKLGAGTLTLAAGSTYTGGTTIASGTLALGTGGSLALTTNINIAAGAVFSVGASYTLASGASLTASGTASPAAISGTAISLGSSPIILNYDGVHPALTISTGGTLKLKGNAFTVNGSPLPVGGPHVLIQQTSGNITSSGTYTVAGTAIGSGTQGAITVSGGQVLLNITQAVTVNQQPPDMVFTSSPNNITIGWPTNLGWRLVYQSNSVGVGLSTNANNWVTWPNSTTVTQVVIPIGTTNEVFFQLVYP
jgi:autotransporter-associated beta strand protein